MMTARLIKDTAADAIPQRHHTSTQLVPNWTARTIGDLAAQVDRDFQSAGFTLGEVLSTFDGIVSQLERLAAPGESDGTSDTLDRYAAMLNDLPRRHAAQAALLDQARDIYRSLTGSLNEIRRIVMVLGIYGVNVKIVATSADVDSHDLIRTMTQRLEQGGANVDRFGHHLERLQHALDEIVELGDLLSSQLNQCIPSVPNQLVDARQSLDGHRAALAETGRQMADLLGGMKRHVTTALVAVQIGDLTRQRFEHVGAGMALFESCEARHGSDGSARAHASNLLLTLFESARGAFATETRTLNGVFEAIGPGARQLQALRGQGAAGAGGQHILNRLESSVTAGQVMSESLRGAERMMSKLISLFPEIVRGVTDNVDALNDLRRDVQQLSINIGLRYRENNGAGKAARILAGEIHVHSRSLEIEARNISRHLDRLNTVAAIIAEQSRVDAGGDSLSLGCVAAAIRQGAEAQERDARNAASSIGRLLESVDGVGALLARQNIDALSDPRPHHSPASDDSLPGWYHAEFLPQLYAIYTMADERAVHRQLCPAEAAAPAPEAPAAAGFEDFEDFTMF